MIKIIRFKIDRVDRGAGCFFFPCLDFYHVYANGEGYERERGRGRGRGIRERGSYAFLIDGPKLTRFGGKGTLREREGGRHLFVD